MIAARLMLYAICWENVLNIEKVCQSVLKKWNSMLKAEISKCWKNGQHIEKECESVKKYEKVC